MKNTLLVLLICASSIAFGQSKKELIAKKWKLDKVEDFGQLYDPMDNQKKDNISFNTNGSFEGIVEGLHIEGKWSATSSKVVLTVNKKLSKLKINWTKVKTVEKEKFALEYQNGDLITSTLLFIPAE